MRLPAYLILLALTLPTGCATTAGYRRVCQAWVGHDADRLVRSWGPPSRESALQSGGRILEWVNNGGSYTHVSPNGFGGAWASTTHYSCKTRFTVNDENRIVYWSFDGNSCRAR
jgi:hypothetical protein